MIMPEIQKTVGIRRGDLPDLDIKPQNFKMSFLFKSWNFTCPHPAIAGWGIYLDNKFYFVFFIYWYKKGFQSKTFPKLHSQIKFRNEGTWIHLKEKFWKLYSFQDILIIFSNFGIDFFIYCENRCQVWKFYVFFFIYNIIYYLKYLHKSDLIF